jgi:translation initiation factor 1A
MVKNTQGGSSHKKFARKFNTGGIKNNKLRVSEDEGEIYGLVIKMLGNNMFHCHCMDGIIRLGHIRGKFKRRVWINPGDTVLISLREFEDDKADVIHKYSPEEAELLKFQGEFDPSLYKNLSNQDGSTNVQQLVMEITDHENENIDFENL